MKKLILSSALTAALLFTTACGGGEKGEVNNDSVISKELTDSMSRALGAFMGVNLKEEVRFSNNVDDFIEGYQLVAGHEFSREKLLGIRAGMYAAEQFMNMSAQGVEVNRDLYLQEFRNYLQKEVLTEAEYQALYTRYQEIIQQIENILLTRDKMRLATEPQTEVPVEVVEETVVEEEEVVPEHNSENSVSQDIIEPVL